MSNEQAVTEPRGSRIVHQVGSMAASLGRRELRFACGSWHVEPLQTLGFFVSLVQQQRLIAETRMTLQHAPLLDAA